MIFPGGDSETSEVLDAETWRSWSQGPRWYYVLAAMIRDERVERRRQHVAEVLGPTLQLTSPGQPHVTVRAIGFEPYDWTPLTVELEVLGPDTFTTAVYLKVKSPEIMRLRKKLDTVSPALPVEDRQTPYIPHVTVGTYLERVSLQEVQQALDESGSMQPIPLTAEVRQVAVDTRSTLGQLRD